MRPMSDGGSIVAPGGRRPWAVGMIAAQVRVGLITALRNPRVLVFTLGFPVVLLALFDSIFNSGDDSTTFAGGTISGSAYLTAGMIAYAIASSAFTTLLISLTTQREAAMLKRLRGTPVPSWTFVAAQIARAVVMAIAIAAVLMAIGMIVYDVPSPGERLIGFIAYVLLGAACLSSVAIALTSFLRTEAAASSVGPFAVVILSFNSGVFIPTEQLPDWLYDIGRIFPLAPLADGLQRCLIEEGGTGLTASNVALLGFWLAGSAVIASRTFKWEPQGRT